MSFQQQLIFLQGRVVGPVPGFQFRAYPVYLRNILNMHHTLIEAFRNFLKNSLGIACEQALGLRG